MTDDAELVQILDLSPLERYSLATSRTPLEERRKVFTCYISMREKIGTDYLPIVNSAVPYINDHTRKHLRRVLKHIEAILVRQFPQPSTIVGDVPRERLLTWADALILLNALVWHDLGNMYGREGHAAVVKKCFDDVSGHLYSEHLGKYVQTVAEAHSGEEAIERIIPNSHSSASYLGEDVHPQFLAAVLRFADELDEDHDRISPTEWRTLQQNGKPLVPPKSHRFWYFSERNVSISVRTHAGDHNLRHSVNIVSHIPRSEFDLKFPFEGRRKICALTEYFRRVFKIEWERQYCNRYIRNAYYHPGISSIKVRLETHEQGTQQSSAECYEFEFSDESPPVHLLKQPRLAELHDYIRDAGSHHKYIKDSLPE